MSKLRSSSLGPDVYICDSCIDICKCLLDRERGALSSSPDDIEARITVLKRLFETKDITKDEFDKKLKELVARL